MTLLFSSSNKRSMAFLRSTGHKIKEPTKTYLIQTNKSVHLVVPKALHNRVHVQAFPTLQHHPNQQAPQDLGPA